MFEFEVQIMSKIIEILNSKGVYLIYIYDALACKKSDLELVKAVMEEVVLNKNYRRKKIRSFSKN